MKRAKLLLQKFQQSATDFTDEKVFSVATSFIGQSAERPRLYGRRDTRKRSIAAERLLRCRPTFSKSLMVSMAVSKLGCSPVFFDERDVTID